MGILEDVKKGFLFADGGMGTMLQDSGLKPGELPETWNEIHADIIQDVHYKYLCAGADYLTTNSFGGITDHGVTFVAAPELLIGYIVCGIVLSLLAAVLPATRAARLRPLEAIHED